MALDTSRPAAGYELVDAGDGRRLDQFGGRLVDRPAASAVDKRRDPAAWPAADLRFDRTSGWRGATALESWPVSIAGLTLELRTTETGQVGLFPEQAGTWDFVRDHVRAADDILNLFGYTGVATLVAASAGASAVHVDASRPTTAWARRNAAAAGLDDRPVRWIVDDVEAFLRREGRRGHRYRGIVLDPPSYGHSPAGRAWRLEERLPVLLDLVAAVAAEGRLRGPHRPHARRRAGRALRRPVDGARARPAVERRARAPGTERGPPATGRLGAHDSGRMTEPAITSTANPRIRAAAALRDRGARDAAGLTIVDGAREILRAIEAGIAVEEAFICEALVRTDAATAATDALRRSAVRAWTTSEAAFGKVAFGDRTEGVVAIVRPPSASLAELRLPDRPVVVVLEAVEKPGNLGAVLRSADGAGADALILADPRTDPWNPNVIRASLGTAFTVPIAIATGDEVRAYLAERGIRPLAARVDGAMTHWDADLRGPVAVVLGSEHDGLTEAWTASERDTIRLPMHGVADSLNVSVAAAVLLYEARRQRSQATET